MTRLLRVEPPAQRLVTIKAAADYCGMSTATFKRECDVKPIAFGANANLFRIDLKEIDMWIERRKLGMTEPVIDWLERVGR